MAWLLLAGLVLLPGCGDREAPAAASKSTPRAADSAVQVREAQRQFLTVEAVGAESDAETLALPGRIMFRPQAHAALGAPVAGRVSAVLVRPGQAVAAGAALLVLDSADAAAARAALDQSASRLVAAENVHRRQIEMVQKGVGLEVERQEAEARLKEARAEHERARHAAGLIGAGQGNRFTLRAPSDGVVIAIRTAVGAVVAPGGEPLLELGDPKRLQVVAQVPESELRRVAVGQEAEITLPALATRLAARVESFSPRVEPDSRRAQLYLAFTGAAEGLRAGMLAQVALRVPPEQGLVVPVAAVLIKDGKRRVVYVERGDGAFEAREVETGRSREGRVTILKGLRAGERIVVRGALLLDTQAEQLL